MGIKIDEKYDAPWKVMKAASEGKRVAFKAGLDSEYKPTSNPTWNWQLADYAIIDDSKPEIDWSGFDWGFFNQYGGLLIKSDLETYAEVANGLVEQLTDSEFYLRESPFYPWFGGECPVPGNVEVEARFVEEVNTINATVIETELGKSGVFVWSGNDDRLSVGDIIAFRLTGRVL